MLQKVVDYLFGDNLFGQSALFANAFPSKTHSYFELDSTPFEFLNFFRIERKLCIAKNHQKEK
jgi:hypothetical protein